MKKRVECSYFDIKDENTSDREAFRFCQYLEADLPSKSKKL